MEERLCYFLLLFFILIENLVILDVFLFGVIMAV